MLLLQYDPTTTEVIFKEAFVPPVTATFSEFTLTSTLSLNQGTVIVTTYLDLTADGSLEVASNSIIEVV